MLIHQKMFESRLFFVDKLIDMGAQIVLCDPHRAAVIGLGRTQRLRGITMSSPDIRAGVSLLIAAMSAEGKSIIQNIEQIDRGYQYIDERLNRLGASIKRIINISDADHYNSTFGRRENFDYPLPFTAFPPACFLCFCGYPSQRR